MAAAPVVANAGGGDVASVDAIKAAVAEVAAERDQLRLTQAAAVAENARLAAKLSEVQLALASASHASTRGNPALAQWLAGRSSELGSFVASSSAAAAAAVAAAEDRVGSGTSPVGPLTAGLLSAALLVAPAASAGAAWLAATTKAAPSAWAFLSAVTAWDGALAMALAASAVMASLGGGVGSAAHPLAALRSAAPAMHGGLLVAAVGMAVAGLVAAGVVATRHRDARGRLAMAVAVKLGVAIDFGARLGGGGGGVPMALAYVAAAGVASSVVARARAGAVGGRVTCK